MGYNMKLLRIELTQNKAHYRKEETVENKMTYPLPPYSTVIGALHKACDFKEYHKMDISIQGRYKSLTKDVYIENIFLDSLLDDRGKLVKLCNEKLYSTGYTLVAKVLQKRNSSFKKSNTIDVYDEDLLKEYKYLKENDAKNEELKKYRNLVTSIKYYEVLNDVELVLHIASDEETLEKIKENIYKLKSIGRSEDFIDIQSCKFVETKELEVDEVKAQMSGYIKLENIRKNKIFLNNANERDHRVSGTRYYLNKDYKIEKNKRKFNKKVVVYSSNYIIEETSLEDKVFYDGEYIFDLV